MRTVRSHSFNGIKYKVDLCDGLDGVCDDAACERDGPPTMIVLDGSDIRSLHSQIHEAMEANGMCDACLHDKDGFPRTWDIARFLYRLGWRRSCTR